MNRERLQMGCLIVFWAALIALAALVLTSPASRP